MNTITDRGPSNGTVYALIGLLLAVLLLLREANCSFRLATGRIERGRAVLPDRWRRQAGDGSDVARQIYAGLFRLYVLPGRLPLL